MFEGAKIKSKNGVCQLLLFLLDAHKTNTGYMGMPVACRAYWWL